MCKVKSVSDVSPALSTDWSTLWCEFERRLSRRLLLVLCGAVQNVVVLKILKQRAEPSETHQGQIC